MNEFNNDGILYVENEQSVTVCVWRIEAMCWWKFCFRISVNCPGMRQKSFVRCLWTRERDRWWARQEKKIVSEVEIETKCRTWLPYYSIQVKFRICFPFFALQNLCCMYLYFHYIFWIIYRQKIVMRLWERNIDLKS